MKDLHPQDWDQRIKYFREKMETPLKDYKRYKRWARGDFRDIDAEMGLAEGQSASVNMVAMVLRSFLAHLFFGPPGVAVKSIEGHRSPELAKVETDGLNDLIDQTNLFKQGKLTVMDGFLAPFMCFKVGYNADIDVNVTWLESENQKVVVENKAFLADMNVGVHKTDNDSLHINGHELLYQQVLEGNEMMPASARDNLKAHIEKHYKRREEGLSYTSEVLRAEKVFISRRKPTAIFFDTHAPDLDSLSWVGEVTVRDLEDVVTDERFTAHARAQMTETLASRTAEMLQKEDTREVSGDGIERVLQYEMICLKRNMVYTYADGFDFYLREAPYAYQREMPNGPYILDTFIDDPDDIWGVAQPKYWEVHQKVVSILNTVQVLTAKAAVPGIGVDGDALSEDEIAEYKSGKIARVVRFKDVGEDIRKHIFILPTPTISQEVFAVLGQNMQFIERLSGLGQTRLGGGERSKTATASQMIDDAIAGMTQEVATRLDQFILKTLRHALRLMRKLYSRSTIARSVGAERAGQWPDMGGWTTTEILDDRGVELLVNTMRRESTDVEIKIMGDIYARVSQDPMVPASAKLKLLDWVLTLAGVPINLTKEIEAMEQNPAAGLGGAAGGGAVNTQGVSREDAQQGVTNVTGGGDGG